MRYGSVCSGIEAASVAWHPLGWKAAFFSELEPFPCAVLAHHYPDTPNHGDMTKFKEWPDAAIDVLVGGTPCQSFSVAGLRAGLDDPRGNLMLTFGAVAARYRPEWIVWENVPGVLSSNGGRDFGSFLGLLGQLGYGFAYRVLDAQFVRVDGLERAVPQRRRRVFVVGCLGDWRRAAAVLFERESLSGHPAPRRKARETVAGTIGARTGISRGVQDAASEHMIATPHADLPPALKARDSKGPSSDGDGGLIAGLELGNQGSGGNVGWFPPSGPCRTLDTGAPPGVALIASTGNVDHCLNAGGMGRCDYETETMVAHALRSEGFDASEDGTGRGTPLVSVGVDCYNGAIDGAATHTLRAGNGNENGGVPAALVPIAFAQNQMGEVRTSEVVGTLNTNANASGRNTPMAMNGTAVRRLTPRECARLQGFPEVKKQAIILMCRSDHQKNLALAETRNLRSQRPASDAVVKASRRPARHAGQCSRINLLGHDWPVALSVQVDCVRREVRILSQGRLLWSASTAGRQSSSPLRMPVEDFVRLAAPTMGCLVPTMQSGREGVTHPSMCLGSGFGLAALSESEMGELANDAERLRREAGAFMTSITSPVLPSSPSYEQTIQTWSCFVAAAIASFIPEQIRSAGSFALSVEATTEYLDIQFRGKPASDSAKYKALGNSMAVNCMRWIGARIQMVEAIEKARAAA